MSDKSPAPDENPTPDNVRAKVKFYNNIHANVVLDAVTIRNVQSCVQYMQDPKFHTAVNSQTYLRDFHQPAWFGPSASLSSVHQAEKLPENIYENALNPKMNPRMKSNIQKAAVNPKAFMSLQASITGFMNSVNEHGSKKSKDDCNHIATHWFLMIQQMAPHVELSGGKWDGAIIKEFAPLFLPWLVSCSFSIYSILLLQNPDCCYAWAWRLSAGCMSRQTP